MSFFSTPLHVRTWPELEINPLDVNKPCLTPRACSTSPEEGLNLLRKRVLAKSKLRYAKTSDLIVYFDIPFYKHHGKQYPQICEIIRECERPLFPTVPFRRVYVLSAEMNDLAILK